MKALLKQLANAIAMLLVAPAVAWYWLSARIIGRAAALTGLAQALSLLPGITGVYLRRAAYRLVLPHVGEDVFIGFGVLITSPTTALGRNAYIGPYCVLGDVHIEADVLVASHVSIIKGGRQHGGDDLSRPLREHTRSLPRVTIGAGSWLGERSVIMCDVGEGCIVGAGSVLTRPLPALAIAAGVPARVLRYRGEAAPSTFIAQEPEPAYAHGIGAGDG